MTFNRESQLLLAL